ncbi:MAG: FecR family protein [Treponema sp.]|nr:FecR family protein [Treponema sp.]
MKKIILSILLSVISAAFVFSQNGIIREFSGDVELKHAGSSVFIPASAGAVVASNTIISTGFRSSAVIALGGSVITVRPLTRLTLAEIQSSENSQDINVNLQAGRVRVEVNPPAGTRSNFTLQTPSTTASVRGTAFDMDTDNINVNKGRVMFKGTGDIAVMVNGGYSSHSNPSGVPANPADVASSNLAPSAPVGASLPVTSVPNVDLAETGLITIIKYPDNQ